MRHAYWWWLSTAVSAALLVVLIELWMQMNAYEPHKPYLVDAPAAERFLRDNWANATNRGQHGVEPMRTVATGIFLQSLSFDSATEINLTGYIWQRYLDGIHDDIKPGRDEVGFILPEQVDSDANPNTRETYRVPYRANGEAGEVIGWYFDATLRQTFDYARYPFDHKTAWVRLWHRQFWRNIVLVPDFAAYQELDAVGEFGANCETESQRGADPKCQFGIEQDIVLGTWSREDTYFDYVMADYDTDFGIPGYVGQHKFPELRYNVVLKRKFENAFIVYLLPLLLVAMLLFAGLLTVSDDEKLSDRFGFNTSGFIGACSVLFFVVLLAHIQLREQFAGSPIVYIEYFYILMYVLLMLATANVYLFTIRPQRGCGWILYADNIVFKVSYWPAILTCLILISLGVL